MYTEFCHEMVESATIIAEKLNCGGIIYGKISWNFKRKIRQRFLDGFGNCWLKWYSVGQDYWCVFYEDSFYTITYALSNKIKHIELNPDIAISGEWFSGHAIGENLGHIKSADNQVIAEKLRNAFSAWYGNGHIN